jgi:hypothetical protein
VSGRSDLVRAARALDRRTFLRLAGIAAASGLVPAGCAGVPDRYAPSPGAPLAVLSPRGYATLTAAAMRVVGPEGAELIRRRVVDVGRSADDLLARSPRLAAPLRQALVLLEFGVWPVCAKLRPFTSLDGAAQDAVLADLAASQIALKRVLFGGVRSIALTTFYGSSASAALSRYPGPFGLGAVTIADGMAR